MRPRGDGVCPGAGSVSRTGLVCPGDGVSRGLVCPGEVLHTPLRYGQLAVSTQPTGMHSCLTCVKRVYSKRNRSTSAVIFPTMEPNHFALATQYEIISRPVNDY